MLKTLQNCFLLSGMLVLRTINVTVAEDSGILRSLIIMIFWGVVSAAIVLPIILN